MTPTYTIKQAIQDTAESFLQAGQRPTPTDSRCTINDLLNAHADEVHPNAYGYNQELAHKRVIRAMRRMALKGVGV